MGRLYEGVQWDWSWKITIDYQTRYTVPIAKFYAAKEGCSNINMLKNIKEELTADAIKCFGKIKFDNSHLILDICTTLQNGPICEYVRYYWATSSTASLVLHYLNEYYWLYTIRQQCQGQVASANLGYGKAGDSLVEIAVSLRTLRQFRF